MNDDNIIHGNNKPLTLAEVYRYIEMLNKITDIENQQSQPQSEQTINPEDTDNIIRIKEKPVNPEDTDNIIRFNTIKFKTLCT